MAVEVLALDGFDFYTLIAASTLPHDVNSRWNNDGSANISELVTPGRFGGQAIGVNFAASGSSGNLRDSFTAGGTRAMGVATRIAAMPAADANLIALSFGTTDQVTVRVTPTGTLKVVGAVAGTLGTSSAALVLDTYASVELEVKMGVTDGHAKLWLNGTLVVNATNVNTTDGTNVTINSAKLYFRDTLSVSGNGQRFDDYYAAAARIGFSYGPRVVTYAPDADVNTQFIPNGAGDNYQELPVPYASDLSTVNFNISSANGALDTDELGAPAIPADAEAPFAAVSVECSANANGIVANATYRAKIWSGGSNVEGATSPNISGGTPQRAFVLASTDPNGSVDWTRTSMDAVRIGYRTVAIASTRKLRVGLAATMFLVGAPTPPPIGAEITHTPLLVLAEGQADAQITQTPMLVLSQISNEGLITANVNLVLSEFVADSQITQAVILALVPVQECITRFAQCWKITREDGVVKAFTTHDQAIVHLGISYVPCDSLRASAVSSTAFSGASTGDVQITGILSEDAVSTADLYSGKYDDAAVEVTLVDWLSGAYKPLTRGIVTKTVQRETSYELTALTGGARMEQQPLLDVFSPLCRWEFGGRECGVNAEALRITSFVDSTAVPNVVTSAQRRTFIDTARVEPVETYRNARLTWTSGNNAGLLCEVKDIVGTVVTLWQPTPADIQAGDAYTMVPGCAKTKDDCTTRFNNYINFGGFPDLPGSDALNETPDR